MQEVGFCFAFLLGDIFSNHGNGHKHQPATHGTTFGEDEGVGRPEPAEHPFAQADKKPQRNEERTAISTTRKYSSSLRDDFVWLT